MWQSSFSDFVFQALVLLQPLFWMWLHGSGVRLPEKLKYVFYLAAGWAALMVLATGFSVGFYTTSLIVQYIIFTVAAVAVLNSRYSFRDALCLGFLLVWLNSYYWEAPLHLAEVLSGGLHYGVVVQLWRLAPAPFLLSRYRFEERARAFLALGLSFSVAVMWLRYFLHFGGAWINPLNRAVCLALLVKVMAEAEVK